MLQNKVGICISKRFLRMQNSRQKPFFVTSLRSQDWIPPDAERLRRESHRCSVADASAVTLINKSALSEWAQGLASRSLTAESHRFCTQTPQTVARLSSALATKRIMVKPSNCETICVVFAGDVSLGFCFTFPVSRVELRRHFEYDYDPVDSFFLPPSLIHKIPTKEILKTYGF